MIIYERRANGQLCEIRTEEQRRKIMDRLDQLTDQDVCLAYSGGVDSALLLCLLQKLAVKKSRKVFAVMFDTELHPKTDAKIARETAETIGADFRLLKIRELEQKEVLNNPVDRCYHCKKLLFHTLKEFASAHGCTVVMEGTNADDLQQYRPGIQAIRELGIISPLAETGMSKKSIREWAAELKIPVADRPSAPCLATRIPYGERLIPEVLERIGKSEEELRKLGLIQVRCRLHGTVLRIETGKEQFSLVLKQYEQIVRICKENGFLYITLDLEGFRSGSMDIMD